jgi:hypothetical protein
MLRSQRILIGVSLPLLAALMHFTLCDWRWRDRADPGEPILVYHHRDSSGLGAYGITITSGLFARSGSAEVAILFGVVTPLALLAADAYLMLGWRYRAAIRRGRCPNCGYDRKGDRADASARCPECGWSAPSPGSSPGAA